MPGRLYFDAILCVTHVNAHGLCMHELLVFK